MIGSRRRRLAGATVLMMAAFVTAAGAAGTTTTLVSVSSSGEPGDGYSYLADVSGDGTKVAFLSESQNFGAPPAAEATFPTANLFIRDLAAGTTTYIAPVGSQYRLGEGPYRPSLSHDGRYVAFASAETLAGDNPESDDVFLYDTATATTTLISKQSTSDGSAAGDADSFNAGVSADGRYVVFVSLAENLSNADVDGATDIFLRDTVAGTTTLISRRSDSEGGAAGAENSRTPAISSDGKYVVFSSNAKNLTKDEVSGRGDIYLRDVTAGTTELVSLDPKGKASSPPSNYGSGSGGPAVSTNGRYVSFVSTANDLSKEDGDGEDVFLRDRRKEKTLLVSKPSNGFDVPADDRSRVWGDTDMSDNGRYVVFATGAGHLSSIDDKFPDVFVRDVKAGVTALVSRQSDSEGGNGGENDYYLGSDSPTISADGRIVAFDSYAENLSAIDGGNEDVFVRDVFGANGQLSDGDDPSVEIDAADPQRLGGSNKVKVRVACDEPCLAEVGGIVKPTGGTGRKFDDAPIQRALISDSLTLFKLEIGTGTLKDLRAAGDGSAKLFVTVYDDFGNKTAKKLTIKLQAG